MGKYDKSIECSQRMLKIATDAGDKLRICYIQSMFGDVYRAQNKNQESIDVYTKELQQARQINNVTYIYGAINGIGMAYESMGRLDKAVTYYLEAFNGAIKMNTDTYNFEQHIATTYFRLKNYPKALYYAKDFLASSEKRNDNNSKLQVYRLLKNIYAASGDYKEAYNVVEKYNNLRNSINSDAIQNRISLLEAGYNTEKQAKAIEYLQKKAILQSRLRNLLIGASVLLLIIAFLVANRFRLKKRSETILASKNAELIHTIDKLKSTQTQLIQSEKMASLGELTAGIAHEIQNPLNFVNNFSEVNTELMLEMQEEFKKGDLEEIKALAFDIYENEKKINQHGKRADGIVKGMLEHSRTRSGQKEPTDLNMMADEFIRLSYHGLRAKDKSFNAELKTHFDAALPKINVVQQDMGRVLLNLFNNAFYAVQKQEKTAGAGFRPEVSVTTSTENGKVVIRVKDNGIGIPDAIKEKIMQPFFTTKPTGEGTGLGLSLTYDMVVKGHGGSIQVSSVEGQGSEFEVSLPI